MKRFVSRRNPSSHSPSCESGAPWGRGESFLFNCFNKPLLLLPENFETRGTGENCTLMSAYFYFYTLLGHHIQQKVILSSVVVLLLPLFFTSMRLESKKHYTYTNRRGVHVLLSYLSIHCIFTVFFCVPVEVRPQVPAKAPIRVGT